jgi:hypothetical protein
VQKKAAAECIIRPLLDFGKDLKAVCSSLSPTYFKELHGFRCIREIQHLYKIVKVSPARR